MDIRVVGKYRYIIVFFLRHALPTYIIYLLIFVGKEPNYTFTVRTLTEV